MNWRAWDDGKLGRLAAQDAVILVIQRDTIDEREAFLTLKKLVIRVDVRKNLKLQVPLIQVYKDVIFGYFNLLSLSAAHLEYFKWLFCRICLYNLVLFGVTHSIDHN